MIRENLTALFMLYFRPVAGISRILDHGRLWFAIVAALAVSFVVHIPAARFAAEVSHPRMVRVPAPSGEEAPEEATEPRPQPAGASHILWDAWASWIGFVSFFAPIGALALVFIPVVIFVRAVSGYGSFSVLMRGDYLSMLLCVLMTWAAAYLPLAVVAATIGMNVNWSALMPLFLVSNLYFAVLAALSIRSLWGTEFGAAIGLTLIGCAAAVIGIALSDFAGPFRYYLLSPFLLYYLYAMFGSDVRSLGEGLRGQRHLQQQLQVATNNPRDSDAHYQLGLIYQKRRQYSEAIARFERAIEIDPTEADAQFQLGRIAREQGRFEDAIRFLTAAARLNDKLSSSEVWRELGAAYLGASRLEEAVAALQKYTDRRSYDPEGLYWYGKALAGLGREKEAREMFKQCVEAVDTMPKHRRAEVRKWKGLALKG